MTELAKKIRSAKADTLMRINNVIWAKVSDAENSKWRSAFGEKYPNAFINMALQAKKAEFLDNEPLKPVKERRKSLVETYNVREEEPKEYTD